MRVSLSSYLPLLGLALAVSSCGNGLDGARPESDPDAVVLGNKVGVMIVESSASLDGAAIESILPGTHRRVRTEGVMLGNDLQLRRIVDAKGTEHLFTIHSDQGVVIERDREGRAGRRFEVYDRARGPASANPLDVAIANDESVWITRHGERSLMVFAKDGAPPATVDLSAFADDDGVPDMSAITIVDDVAYVALRRLEKGFGTRKNASHIVAIDVTTRTPSLFVELPVKDPGAKFLHSGSELWISCIGGPLIKDALGNPDPDRSAGLVRIDLAARKATVALSADAANGFVTAFDLVDERTGYAVVAEFAGDNPTSVVKFDPTAGKLLEGPWLRTSGYKLWDITALTTAEGQGLLLVADRTEERPGLRILRIEDGSRAGFLPTRLLPIQQIVLRSQS